jgi:hypothetical protein
MAHATAIMTPELFEALMPVGSAAGRSLRKASIT